MRHFISDETKKEASILAFLFLIVFISGCILFVVKYFVINDFTKFNITTRRDIVFEGVSLVVLGIGLILFSYYHIRFSYATWELCTDGIHVQYFFSHKVFLWDEFKQICVCKLLGKGTREIPVICCCTDPSIEFYPLKRSVFSSQKKRTWRSTDFVIYRSKKVVALPFSNELEKEIKQYCPLLIYI